MGHDNPPLIATVRDIFLGIGVLISSLGGFGFLGYQIYLYLKGGEWISYSALHLVKQISPQAEAWTINPDSWLGLHSVLDWLPLSGVLVIGGMMAAGWCATTIDKLEKARNTQTRENPVH